MGIFELGPGYGNRGIEMKPPTALDCPINCGWLITETWACACELGIVPGAQITEADGGECRIEREME